MIALVRVLLFVQLAGDLYAIAQVPQYKLQVSFTIEIFLLMNNKIELLIP